MRTLGKLLSTLCSHSLLKPHLLKQRSSHTDRFSSKRVFTPQLTITSHVSSRVLFKRYQLHFCCNYTPSQLMRMIVEIYQGVPEGFAVFHCHPTTSAEELNLFIERIRHHRLPYLVLLVNQLPFKLQEVGTETDTNIHVNANTHIHVP